MIPEDYERTCEYFRGLLAQISRGEIALPLPGGAINEPRSNTLDQEKVFTRSKFDHGGARLNEEEDGSLDVP